MWSQWGRYNSSRRQWVYNGDLMGEDSIHTVHSWMFDGYQIWFILYRFPKRLIHQWANKTCFGGEVELVNDWTFVYIYMIIYRYGFVLNMIYWMDVNVDGVNINQQHNEKTRVGGWASCRKNGSWDSGSCGHFNSKLLNCQRVMIELDTTRWGG